MKTGTLQTLQRGLDALDLIADHPHGLSVARLAELLGVDRAIAYRIAATLEAGGFVSRAAGGTLHLGGAVLALAARIEPHLRAHAEPALKQLAADTLATAFMSVARGREAEAVLVCEPDAGLIRVGYRTGSRHPLDLGAAGLAILAGRPEKPEDTHAVCKARADGYSVTKGQLQKGAIGIAAPLRFSQSSHAGLEACIGVVALDDLAVDTAAPLVIACAAGISSRLAGSGNAARPHSPNASAMTVLKEQD
ncbi:IclR family transcriptional regulator [Roseibium aquae]|nr:helix-turn-helix domain-containing protein [Roseibium aquae]